MMKMTCRVLLSTLAIMSGAAWAAQPQAPDAAYASQNADELAAFKKVIRQKYALQEKALVGGDVESFVRTFYAGDALVVASCCGFYFGRKDILPQYQQDTEGAAETQVKIESVHTYVNGNAGWDWTDLHVTDQHGKEVFTSAQLYLWSKIDGEWVCLGGTHIDGSVRAGKLAPATASDK